MVNKGNGCQEAWCERDGSARGHERGGSCEMGRNADDPQELFRKTVGPLRDVFLIYNSQGHSKGMAIVAFQRKGDAAVARAKYHGKVVDGRTCTNVL